MLNENQKRAVEFLDGPALVLAGPGSGKTTVITRRIENLVKHGVDPTKILVITFTRAAAKQMYDRFKKLCPGVSGVNFGTFHSVFFHILSRECHYKSEDILKESTKYKLLKDVLRKQNISLRDEEALEAVFAAISKVKGRGIEINHLSEDEFFELCIVSLDKRQFVRTYKSYLESLEKNHLIDFDDMVEKTYELFLERNEILRRYQSRFSYILIDEFQDISPLQYEVVKMMALPNNNLFVVGDDDQSIYGFRGASPSIMLGFDADFAGTTVINLDVNYRCCEEIVSKATGVIEKNKDRFNKTITCGSLIEGGQVKTYAFYDEVKEASFVAETIENLHKRGLPYNEMAVLYRNHHLAEATSMQLLASNIPARIKRNNKYRSGVVKDVLSFLNIALGEGKRADYLNVMNKPDRGIMRQALDGEVSLFSIRDYYEGDEFVTNKIDNWILLNKTLVKLEPSGALSLIRYGFSYESYLKQNDFKNFFVLEKLIEDAKAFKSLMAFRKYLLEYEDNSGEMADFDENGVGFYTLHASKGLEFNTVFIIQANDGIIPQRKGKTDSALEEERRLFYVGMTRAKENLFITTTQKSQGKEMAPSEYLG